MIDHKQSVAEHVLAVAERERKERESHARRVAKRILRAIGDMAFASGPDAADGFFPSTVVRTRAKLEGVQEEFLQLVEDIVSAGREHD